MSTEARDQQLADLTAEAHRALNEQIRGFAEWAGVVCKECVLPTGVAACAVANRSAYNCDGPVSATDVEIVYGAAGRVQRQVTQGQRCPTYQCSTDGYVNYRDL